MMLADPYCYPSRLGLFDDLAHSMKAAFRGRLVKTAVTEAEQSTGEAGERKSIDVQNASKKQASENIPSCPCCNAIMDDWGFWFASKIHVDGMIYYCNNPICNGCPYNSSIRQDITTQESENRVSWR